MKRLALGIVVVLAAIFVVGSVRALRLTSRHITVPPADAAIAAAPVSADHLAAALRFSTISTENPADWDSLPFLAFHQYLANAFPRVAATLSREVVNSYSLLYTWRGTDTTLAPVLLMGHFDVVPVEKGTESSWTHPPFSGVVADGYVWGRGALDDKVSVIAVLEAAELLLNQGYQPRRTIYFAFGHDEEIGGANGAEFLSRTLQTRTKHLAFLVDEGGMIARGLLTGVSRPVALIGVVEKASASLELTVEGAGGHSSVPPNHTALGVLARALTKIEDHQMPARMTPVSERMFTTIAPEMGFGARFALANLWLLRPLLVTGMLRDEKTASMVRTSTAVTMASASPKQNVLPIHARAVVNFRILPGDRPNDVLEHVRRVVNDTSVHLRFLDTPLDPSPIADMGSPEFATMEKTIAQVDPDAVTVPFLLTGATDTRHYEVLTRNVFRFIPVSVTPELLTGAHGTNERVRVEDFQRSVRFFAQLMKNAQ